MTESESDHPADASTDDGGVVERRTNATRVAVPGIPTVTDKRTPPTERASAFKCPFCEFTADTDRIVRTHITREDDADHRNRNGFLDQIFVHRIDDAGEVVDELDSPGTTRYTGDETTSLVPDGIDPDSKAGRILQAAILHPTLSPSDLKRRLDDELGDEAPSRNYVYSVLDSHLGAFNPDDDDGDGDESQNTVSAIPGGTEPQRIADKWNGLTTKQQRVIVELIRDPHRSNADIQRAAGVSAGYLSATGLEDKYDSLIAHLRAKVEAGSLSLDSLEPPRPDDDDGEGEGEGEGEDDDEVAVGLGDVGKLVVKPVGGDSTGTGSTCAGGVVELDAGELDAFADSLAERRDLADQYREAAPEGSTMHVGANVTLQMVDEFESFLERARVDDDR